MITAPRSIDFIEDAGIMNPNGGSTFDVAMKLEIRYSVLAKFVALHKYDIERAIAFAMADAIKHGFDNDRMDAAIELGIKPMWQAYLLNEEHGIHTRAAEKNNRQSFVDTGTYLRALKIGVAR
jgi:hypothetical protein